MKRSSSSEWKMLLSIKGERISSSSPDLSWRRKHRANCFDANDRDDEDDEDFEEEEEEEEEEEDDDGLDGRPKREGLRG